MVAMNNNNYEAGFNLDVIVYAEEYGNSSTERNFVSEKLASDW